MLFTCSRSGSKNEVPRGRDGWKPAQTRAFLFEPSQYPEHPEGEQQTKHRHKKINLQLKTSTSFLSVGVRFGRTHRTILSREQKSHKSLEDGGTGSSRGAASGCEETYNGQILRKTRRFYWQSDKNTTDRETHLKRPVERSCSYWPSTAAVNSSHTTKVILIKVKWLLHQHLVISMCTSTHPAQIRLLNARFITQTEITSIIELFCDKHGFSVGRNASEGL